MKRAKSIESQEDGGSAHNVVQPKKSTRICTNPKRARLQDDDISGDKCCVCFQDFEEDVELGIGIEWVSVHVHGGFMKTVFWTASLKSVAKKDLSLLYITVVILLLLVIAYYIVIIIPAIVYL